MNAFDTTSPRSATMPAGASVPSRQVRHSTRHHDRFAPYPALTTDEPMVSSQPNLFLAPQLLGELPEPRDVVIVALHLSLKPVFVPCMFLAGPNLASLPISKLWPSILDPRAHTQGARQYVSAKLRPSSTSHLPSKCLNGHSKPRHLGPSAAREKIEGSRMPLSPRTPSASTHVVITGNVYIKTTLLP
jgi:hypothetical protein